MEASYAYVVDLPCDPSYLSNRAFRCQTNNMIHANAWGDLPQKPLPERGASSEHLHDLNYYDDTTQYICARFPSSLQLESASKDSPYLEEKIRVVPSAEGEVYIVYLGEHAGEKVEEAILEDHHTLLLSVKSSEEEARASLLYSYKHTLNGFATFLSKEEATKLWERSEVVSAFRSEGRWAPHTTRSWQFLGFEEGLINPPDGREWLPSLDKSSEDIIVGILDSGIWPESRSFSDQGLGPRRRHERLRRILGGPLRFADDGIALGALHAAKRGVVVSCCGGNSGPKPATVSNLALWMLTVAASSIDRAFHSPIKLGNGAMVMCLPNSLSSDKVRGKIVVCFRGTGLRVEKGLEVKRAGGAAILLGNPAASGSEVPVDAHVLRGTAVAAADANTILSYINSSSSPTAVLDPSRTVVDVRPSPVMAQFSSRGPNVLEPSILKPDITAPGLNILAAWSEASSPTKLDGDHRVVQYNLMSGTSMTCPHVSAAAVLIKAAHPDWSSAAIRSAIMTTATTNNAEGGPLMNGDGSVAGPMDYGSGHIRPKHALDPGLVYDASYQDYLLFACASAGSQLDRSVPCPARPPPPYQLNHPSVAVHGLNGSVTVHRTVTNVGPGKARYTVAVVETAGVSVKVSPRRLSFARTGEKKAFRIKVEAKGSSIVRGQFVAGSYAWSDGAHVVRSPVVVLVA
ncbi:unnamed protein product [Miscanthus lutarioriparius]|uniref:Uncharacterized protein n=1 Tax=Miscanthus lutarioriparius TaxID=422564 RepID=A0A811P406_9POAL|nr:unnamed protein product [Miscanthus lutarioriparius]